MEDSGNQNQTRFLIAAVLSMAILFGWSYFFAPPPKPADNANVATNTNTAQSATPQNQQTVATQTTQPEIAASTEPDTTPNRTITIKSPLYEVKLDSRGAVATSWIILRNKSPRGDFAVFGDGSNTANEKPLQLISDEALKRSPREIPFRLATDDQNLTTLINDRNYQISASEETITLSAGQEKQIEFTLTDASGVEVKKTFVFRAESYIADLAVDLKKGGQTVPNTKLLIGASIGDHAINHHTFYHIESEAVAAVNGDIKSIRDIILSPSTPIIRLRSLITGRSTGPAWATLILRWRRSRQSRHSLSNIERQNTKCRPNRFTRAFSNGYCATLRPAKRDILLRLICRYRRTDR